MSKIIVPFAICASFVLGYYIGKKIYEPKMQWFGKLYYDWHEKNDVSVKGIAKLP